MAVRQTSGSGGRGAAGDSGTSFGKLNGRLSEYLLRANVRPGLGQGPKDIAGELKVSYSTVTAHLRRLVSTGRAFQRYIVNPFRTRFCHEFRVGLRLDAHQIKKAYDATFKSPDSKTSRKAAEYGGPIEWFVEHLIEEVSQHEWLVHHLIITDGVILHGAPGRDVELTVLTDDGMYSAGRYVREVLVAEPGILEAMTQTVAWRYRFLGYSGRHANGVTQPAGREAATT